MHRYFVNNRFVGNERVSDDLRTGVHTSRDPQASPRYLTSFIYFIVYLPLFFFFITFVDRRSVENLHFFANSNRRDIAFLFESFDVNEQFCDDKGISRLSLWKILKCEIARNMKEKNIEHDILYFIPSLVYLHVVSSYNYNYTSIFR